MGEGGEVEKRVGASMTKMSVLRGGENQEDYKDVTWQYLKALLIAIRSADVLVGEFTLSHIYFKKKVSELTAPRT